MKRLIPLSILLILLLGGGKIFPSNQTKEEEITYVLVDGFEVKGEWELFFSKFRSRAWNPELRGYEPNSKWIKWITSNENKPNFSRKFILPPDIYKNEKFKSEKTIISVRGSWDRQGDNWLALAPSTKRLAKNPIGTQPIKKLIEITGGASINSKNFIILPGETQIIQCYFWGMGYDYKVEAHIQDYKGNYVIIPGSYLNFHGWRNIQFPVPRFVHQRSKILPVLRPLRFIQFKIVTTSHELSTGFFTYVDFLHTRTNIHDKSFFGNSLRENNIYWNESEGKKK